MTSYDTDNISFDGVTKKTQTTRHTWFSRNEWNFGDGATTGAESYLPSLDVFHPYDKGGTFTVRLTTTFPTNLAGQRAEYLKTCSSNPLDPAKPDGRFTQRTAELKLRVKAHYDRIKSRGLWMTSGAKTFSETDFPNVYESTGPIYVNTRRVGYGWNDARDHWDQNADVSYADGVLVVTPVDAPLQVVADRGEILGAAHLAWQSGGEQVALGDMPLKINGKPGLIIPAAGPGGTHDLGVFNDPPATLTSGAAPARGQAFHINAAHPVLREGNGGTLELNVHLPPPLGPNGGESDETVVRDVKGNGRAVTRGNHRVRGILDNFDVDLPKVEIVPDASLVQRRQALAPRGRQAAVDGHGQPDRVRQEGRHEPGLQEGGLPGGRRPGLLRRRRPGQRRRRCSTACRSRSPTRRRRTR